MCDQNRKTKLDIDYKIFNKTGEKVLKSRRSEKMALSEKKLKELKVRGDIQEIFDTCAGDDLETVDEITENLEEMNRLGKEYRHIHIELKSLMGDEYASAYANYHDFLDRIRTFISNEKCKLKKAKLKEKLSETEYLKSSFKTEELVFRDRISRELKVDGEDVSEIKENCSRLDALLGDYYTLLSKAKIIFGDDFEEELKGIFQENIKLVDDKILKGKEKIKKMVSIAEKNDSAEKSRLEQETRSAFIREQKFHANVLKKEIEVRCTSIKTSCDHTVLSDMTDHQILERYKNMTSLDCEMREIFDKVTSYSKIAALCDEERDDMLKSPLEFQEKALNARNTYAKALYTIYKERDISEDKLKSASEINIELSKFKGYESKLDIFSFKSEFEKLVQPKILKRYWVDTLKNNYLVGPAQTLVEKLENLSLVWDKLIEAYGDVKLLLQTKMSNLDKLENLEKIEGDEKLGNAIAKIINMMTELSILAEKHDLQNKLYIGGGLEKVFGLIGEKRERNFLRKNLERGIFSGSSESIELSTEKKTWENLKEFLQMERTLCEKLTLIRKSKECLGLIKPKSKKMARVWVLILH